MLFTVSDEILLERVAARDKEAFQLLFERYGKAAFSVAHYLTNNEAQSEDVVQDAMLTLWTKAGQYDASIGTAKSWILSIVANRAMVGNRKRRNEKMRERVVAERAKDESAAKPPEEAEGKELKAALQQKLQELPAQMRQLIAMYYVCEMKQDEIARMLSMPQSTVSHRIRESLQELRNRLEVAGLAATVPLLDAQCLGSLLMDSHELPEALSVRVLSKLEVARRSVRASAVWSNKVMLEAALLTVAAVAGSAWWLSQGGEPTPPAAAKPISSPNESRSAASESVAVRPSKTPQAEPIYWDFNSPNAPAEIQIQRGSWHWVKDGGPDGSGCWETDEEIFSALLNVKLGRSPACLSLHTQDIPSGESPLGNGCYIYWANARWVALFQNVGKLTAVDQGNPQWLLKKNFLGPEGSIDVWINGHRAVFCVAPPRESETRIQLVVRGRQRLDDLKIEWVAPEDLPDAGPFLAELSRIPVAERVGKVRLPNLASQRPEKEVYVEFDDRASKAQSGE